MSLRNRSWALWAPACIGIVIGTIALAQAQSRRTPSKTSVGPASEPVVARVNGQPITYRQLAEECIARNGPEVLDTMISRAIVMQACQQRGLRVTAQEIDQEIRRTASRLKMTLEQFLKLIKEQRSIDARRYADEIVLPGLALKKLAKPMVKVTDDDVRRGYEALYGEKVRCRWIVLDNPKIASDVWNQLADTADQDDKIKLSEFERSVTRWSTDAATRPIGGQINPITRHTGPTFKELENAAFSLQDGRISKVTQFGTSYVILYREGTIPAAHNTKLEDVRTQIESDIYEAKMRESVGRVFQELQANARVENLLTGDVTVPKKEAAAKSTPQVGRKKAGTRRF